MGANDIPQQLAEDGARALDAGSAPTTVAGPVAVPISMSLAPFVAIYDEQGALLASNGTFDGAPPAVPTGVMKEARTTGRDAVTWQPRAGVRIALVVVPWDGGTIAAGRSLRAIEAHIDAIGGLMAFGWVVAVAIIAMVAGVSASIWPSSKVPERAG